MWHLYFIALLSATSSLSGVLARSIDTVYHLGRRSPDVQAPASQVLSLTRKPAKWRLPKKHRQGNAALSSPSQYAGQTYSAEIKMGSQSFSAVIDTGSSDTWLVSTGYQCVDPSTGASTPESSCSFGPTYNISPTFKQIKDANFNITYGGGSYINGIVGIEHVTLGGIKVSQEVAAVNLAAYSGDGQSSGLIGLAYPNLTAVFSSRDPSADSISNTRIYNPIFTTMYKQKLIPPVFSVALNRPGSTDQNAGYLALGGLPPVPFIPNFASTPILPSTFNPLGGPPYSTPQFQSYTVKLEGVSYGNSTTKSVSNFTPYNLNVDTGYSLNFLDSATAAAVAALFSPSAVMDPDSGNYYVSCNATFPATFGVKLGWQVFPINPVDMIVQNGDENGDGKCVSAVQDGGGDFAVLGDPFLKNVVAVHDVGAEEMRFAKREYY